MEAVLSENCSGKSRHGGGQGDDRMPTGEGCLQVINRGSVKENRLNAF